MAVNKVVYGTETLIDLTSDTVTPDKLLNGITAHDQSGEPITGTCEFDVDSSDGKTAYARGAKLTGTMPNRGVVSGEIDTKDEQFAIQQGYHDGSGKVGIAAAEKAKLIPANIREGISILGVDGEMSGNEGMKPQAKTVTPSAVQQVISPDASYNCLSQVTVNPIPYAESANAAGGTTVTIG